MDFRIIFTFALLVGTFSIITGTHEQEADDDQQSEVAEGDGETEEVVEGCEEHELEACALSFMTAVESRSQGGNNLDELCGGLYETYKCLLEKADLCLDEDEITDLQSDFDDLKGILDENCPDGKHKTVECIENEAKYMMDCITEETANALAGYYSTADIDISKLECTVFQNLVDCVLKRADEKCGQAAVELLADEMPDHPTCNTDKEDSQDSELQDLIPNGILSVLKKKKK